MIGDERTGDERTGDERTGDERTEESKRVLARIVAMLTGMLRSLEQQKEEDMSG